VALAANAIIHDPAPGLQEKIARRRRRALEDAEIGRLLAATEKEPARYGMTGPERALLYRFALETGLRASELRSLTPASVNVADLSRSTVTVAAAHSKHRREDVLPMRRDLAEMLATFIRGRDRSARLLPVPRRTADMLRSDLKAAEIPAEDRSGRVVDFHALRHTCITRLARSGVAPAVAKDLARHSSITLTMDHYTHTVIGDKYAALASLPAIEADDGSEEKRATGTDDRRP